MSIKVVLETNAIVSPGIDQTSIMADIEAEINKLADQPEVKLRRSEKPAPDDAQGGLELIEWVLQVAPARVKRVVT